MGGAKPLVALFVRARRTGPYTVFIRFLKSAADFIAAYVKQADDSKYHVRPTVSPENWGCTVDYRLNQDCIMDLALIDFLLEAVVTGAEILNIDASERQRWAEMRTNLIGYPSAKTERGTVSLDVLNAPVGWIYNIPVTLAPVFPGERVGLSANENTLKIAGLTAYTKTCSKAATILSISRSSGRGSECSIWVGSKEKSCTACSRMES